MFTKVFTIMLVSLMVMSTECLKLKPQDDLFEGDVQRVDEYRVVNKDKQVYPVLVNKIQNVWVLQLSVMMNQNRKYNLCDCQKLSKIIYSEYLIKQEYFNKIGQKYEKEMMKGTDQLKIGGNIVSEQVNNMLGKGENRQSSLFYSTLLMMISQHKSHLNKYNKVQSLISIQFIWKYSIKLFILSLKQFQEIQYVNIPLSVFYYKMLQKTTQGIHKIYQQYNEDPYSQIDEELRHILTCPDRTGYVNISHGNWKTYKMTQYIVQGNLKHYTLSTKLYLGDNAQPMMIPLLTKVSFSNIKGINIWANYIESIELLCTIYMPNIKNFAINGNNLVFPSAFRKCHWPELVTFGLSANKFNQLSVLTQMICPKINQLIISFHIDNRMIEDWRWMGRMEGPLDSVYMMGDDKIEQSSSQKALKRRNWKTGIRK